MPGKIVAWLTLLVATVAFAQSVQIYNLPGEAVFPEGIAADAEAGVFFVSSTTDGTILQGDVATGEVSVFVAGPQLPFTTIGLDVDSQGRLWVAGGGSGQIRVYDIATGDLVATVSTPEAEATFINDVIVVDGEAYATDSSRPILFRIPPTLDSAEPWVDFTGTAFEYIEGFNANGIEVSADGRYLIVVQMNTGNLYRIDRETKAVSLIDLSEGMMPARVMGGDGLELDGLTLYVVQNAAHNIAVLELEPDFSSATVIANITDPSFGFPTTAVKVGDQLLVVNSQFDKMDTEDLVLPFTVSGVPVP